MNSFPASWPVHTRIFLRRSCRSSRSSTVCGQNNIFIAQVAADKRFSRLEYCFCGFSTQSSRWRFVTARLKQTRAFGLLAA
ncbi:MAG: hypothetical protein V3U29_08745 [Phycisphaeraceae bacterium]